MAQGRETFPRRAMVLAAGLGTRMRPLTDTRPKPLLEVRGKSLLDGILDHLAAFGVESVVVNAHHLGEQISEHLQSRRSPPCQVIQEKNRLETGGGVKNALSSLGAPPFFVINGDVLWRDGVEPALKRLASAWDEEKMDVLLLLQPVTGAVGYAGRGDFLMDQDGRLQRRAENRNAPYVFAGMQILHPRLFEGTPDGAFSLNLLYDRALAENRLYGLVHDGEWYHIGTPQNLEEAETILARSENGLSPS